MKLQVLTTYFKTLLDELRAKSVPPKPGEQREDLDKHLDEQLTAKRFAAYIKKLEVYGPETEVTTDHLSIILDAYIERAGFLRKTPFTYLHAMQLPTNQLYVKGAVFLNSMCSELIGKKIAFAILMPTIKSFRNPRDGQDYALEYPQAILPDDNDEYLLDVGYIGLGYVDKTNKLHTSTESAKEYIRQPIAEYIARYKSAYPQDQLWRCLPLYRAVNGKAKNLTIDEVNRIYHHSPNVTKYYDVILDEYRQSKREIDLDTIDVYQKKMRDGLCEKNYPEIRSTYPNGDKLLRENLLKCVNDLFANGEQLFSFMAFEKRSPETDWKLFIDTISQSELNRLVLGTEVIDSKGTEIGNAIDNAKSMFTNNALHDRAVTYCLGEVYRRWRKPLGPYTGIWGRLFGEDVDHKLKAIELELTALAKGTSNYKWDESKPSLESRTVNAIKNGKVGYIDVLRREIDSNNKKVVEEKEQVAPEPLAPSMKR